MHVTCGLAEASDDHRERCLPAGLRGSRKQFHAYSITVAASARAAGGPADGRRNRATCGRRRYNSTRSMPPAFALATKSAIQRSPSTRFAISTTM